VVLTAPIPTSRTPSFPLAGSIFGAFFTTANYIISRSAVVVGEIVHLELTIHHVVAQPFTRIIHE
jgi:hypothetical protein